MLQRIRLQHAVIVRPILQSVKYALESVIWSSTTLVSLDLLQQYLERGLDIRPILGHGNLRSEVDKPAAACYCEAIHTVEVDGRRPSGESAGNGALLLCVSQADIPLLLPLPQDTPDPDPDSSGVRVHADSRQMTNGTMVGTVDACRGKAFPRNPVSSASDTAGRERPAAAEMHGNALPLPHESRICGMALHRFRRIRGVVFPCLQLDLASTHANAYFWRTYAQQEIDLVEEREGKLFGYEFKWRAPARAAAPKAWRAAYPQAEFEVITPQNYLDWVT